MRPLTKAIFEREGKAIVGSRWTLDQVHQAYENADHLLDYVSEFKSFKPVQDLGIDKIHPGFEDGLEIRVAKNVSNEAVQSLSLNILWDLLERGRDVLRSAAWVYKNSPETFKDIYASSKQAFLKDRFFRKKVPEYSFLPFKSGDNPVIVQNEKISQACAHLYQNSACEWFSKNIPLNYFFWLGLPAGDKFSRETSWLQNKAHSLKEKRLASASYTAPIIIPRKQNTL